MFKNKLAQLALAAVMVVSLVAPAVASADTQPRDADSGSIIYNGAYSKVEWDGKVQNGDGVNSAASIQQIYFNEGRGITKANFDSSDTVDGTVYSDGHVVVNGKTVATNGLTVSRTKAPGAVQSGSVWETPTSTVFVAASIPAFVNMQGGVFHYAVIKSCGNPVRATAVPTPTPTPTATPTPTPTATPKPTTVVTPTPTPQVLGASTQPTLPATGAESMLGGVAGLTAMGYGVRGYLRSRKSVVEALRKVK